LDPFTTSGGSTLLSDRCSFGVTWPEWSWSPEKSLMFPDAWDIESTDPTGVSLPWSPTLELTLTEACQFGIDTGAGTLDPFTTNGVCVFSARRFELDTLCCDGTAERGAEWAPVENDRSWPSGDGDREGRFNRSKMDCGS
jgi:hypothetical protein